MGLWLLHGKLWTIDMRQLPHTSITLKHYYDYWEFPGGPVIRLHTFTTKGVSLISAQATKSP